MNNNVNEIKQELKSLIETNLKQFDIEDVVAKKTNIPSEILEILAEEYLSSNFEYFRSIKNHCNTTVICHSRSWVAELLSVEFIFGGYRFLLTLKLPYELDGDFNVFGHISIENLITIDEAFGELNLLKRRIDKLTSVAQYVALSSMCSADDWLLNWRKDR